MTATPIALHFDTWYPGWLRRWCEAYLSFRGRGADADVAYVMANAQMAQPLQASVWGSKQPHDMELAQADVDTHGIQYTRMTSADAATFEHERIGEVPLHNDRNRGYYQPSEPDEVYYPECWWMEV